MQVALAVAILASAGVLVRGLARLGALDTGLAEDRLLFAELSLTGAAADRARHGQVLDAIVARVQSLPGVVAATPVNAWPYAEAGWDVPAFTAEGQDAASAAANPALNFEAIGPRHFDTLQVPIVRGRAFTADDRTGVLAVAIVSADVAARTWPGVSPIGRRLKIGGPDSGEPWLTIVGVAAPTRYRELAAARPTLYVPAAQFLDTAERLAIRTSIPPESVAPAIRGHVEAVDPGVRVLRVATFDAIVAEPLAQPRFHATVSSAFAVTAALLAAIGLYAVLAAAVRHRDREIAIRMAVGATPWTDPSPGGRRGRDARRDRRCRRRPRRRRHRAARGRGRCQAPPPTIRWRWPLRWACCWRCRRWRRTGRSGRPPASIRSCRLRA